MFKQTWFQKIKGGGSSGIVFIISLAVIVAVTVFKLPSLPPQVPLFYSLADGEEQIVDLVYLFFLPLISFLILIVNTLVTKKIFFENIFMQRIFNYTTQLLIILLSIIYLRIIFLVS